MFELNLILYIIQKMEKLKNYLSDISKVFGYEYNQSFFSYLKSISKPNNQVCNKRVEYGEGGWKCLDCEIDLLSLLCNDCFARAKDRHKGHRVIFDPGSNGYCDCGDPNTYIKEGFCPSHKGPFNNQKDLNNFIKSGFNEIILNTIEPILNNIFSLFIEKIDIYFTKLFENQSDLEIEKTELFQMLKELVSLCSSLYNNNLGLFYFVTLKFTENFPYETNHKCYKYNEEDHSITIIKENLLEKHTCICPFFQVLIYVLITTKTEYNSEEFFTLFIQNYKNKLITSISFIHSFIELFSNDNLTIYRGMGYQLLTDNLANLVYDEKNNDFLINFFTEVYNKIKVLLEQKSYKKAEDIYSKLSNLINNLPKSNLLDKIYSQLEVHGIAIETVFLLNNLNIFENKTKFNEFQRDGYEFDLLNCELRALFIGLSTSFLIDYNNLESVKFIFNKILGKLMEYKKYKESLSEKIFTPHIIYLRIYSIFLNRFCFYYSLTNNVDLLNTFQYFQDLFPESKELNTFLFRELISFFGFFISQKYSFFSYFGDGMIYYHINYFSSRVYIQCDITLMKYLLSSSEVQEIFSIEEILINSNIDSSNDFFLSLIKSDLNQKSDELLLKTKCEEKNFHYINSVLEFILQIFRDNISMINLCFKYSDFRMKYFDKLFDSMLKNEKTNFDNILKNQVIHYILGNNNSAQRESCIKIYKAFFNNEDLSLIDNLLKEKCDTISSSNQLKLFSLKKSAFPLCDIDYIIDSKERTNAMKYMTEFQKNNYNLLNVHISNSLSIQEKLYAKIYEIFFYKDNMDKLLKFYNALISNNNYPIFCDTFFFTFSKILCFFIELYKNDKNKEEYFNKIKEILNNCFLKGKNAQSIHYIKKLLSTEDKNGNINELLKKKKNIKDKLKKKYEEKNQLSLSRFSSLELMLEEEESLSSINEEICVFCRQPLNNELNNYYGKICYLLRDFFIDISKNKEKDSRKKNTRFVTCSHKIHFNCYSKFQITLNNVFSKDGYSCPLCKKLSNIIICDFNYLNENNHELLKGMVFDSGYKIISDDFNTCSEDYTNKYNEFFIYNKHFFEKYSSKLLKKEILIGDINSDINLLEEIFSNIINDFDAFTIYYNITNYKHEQIDIWKNILLTIRLLCNYNLISISFFISKFNLSNFALANDFSFLKDSDIPTLINEFIISSIILLDLNEENKVKIKNIFKNYILIYIFVYGFLIHKQNSFVEFLDIKENQDTLKNLFEFYKLKYQICLLLFSENEENLDLDYEETIQFLKNSQNINDLISKNNNIILNQQYFDIPKFNIIQLPDQYMEFCSKFMNINCINCNKKKVCYYICLICGNKICDDKNCIKNNANGKKDIALIDHSIKCGGGNALFIANTTTQIAYILKRQLAFSGIYVYLNNFGEHVQDNCLIDSYILNKIELEKSKQIFIDLVFRKKSMRFNSFN